jgi:hypothetical protein
VLTSKEKEVLDFPEDENLERAMLSVAIIEHPSLCDL